MRLRYRLIIPLILSATLCGSLDAQPDEPIDTAAADSFYLDDSVADAAEISFADDLDDLFTSVGPARDSSTVVVRSAPDPFWAGYDADKRFDYALAEEQVGSNFIEEIFIWLGERFDFLDRLLGAVGAGSSWIVYILFFAALALVLRAITRAGAGSGRLFRRNRNESLEIEEEIEDIERIDFPRQIDRAVAEGDFRRAVRLEYLALLQNLARSGAIDWRPEKTNGDYLRELSGTEMAGPMRDLTRLFDYTWYGRFPVDREAYEGVRPLFAKTGRMIAGGR